MLSPLDGERFCEHRDGALAGAVGAHFEEREERSDRGDVDDAAVFALDHVAAENLARAKRSVEIDFDDVVPLGFGDVERRRALGGAGGVDENFDRAEFGDCGGKESFDAGAIA